MQEAREVLRVKVECLVALISTPPIFGPKKLTRFEKARILGGRALQLSMGAPALVSVEEVKSTDPLDIAQEELGRGLLPITVVRRTPKGEEIKIPLKNLL